MHVSFSSMLWYNCSCGSMCPKQSEKEGVEMLKLSDLKLREYDGKDCVGFVVDVKFGDSRSQRVWFRKHGSSSWQVECILPSGSPLVAVFETYSSMQKLEVIAAAGLLVVQQQLEDVIGIESQLEFAMSDLVRGM